jgi:hypothetical protein
MIFVNESSLIIAAGNVFTRSSVILPSNLQSFRLATAAFAMINMVNRLVIVYLEILIPTLSRYK